MEGLAAAIGTGVLYFREVEQFMRYYPRMDFKMIQLVQMLGGRPASKQEWERKRKAVRRVMDELVRLGFVIERPPRAATGGYKLYRWNESGTRHQPKPVDKPG